MPPANRFGWFKDIANSRLEVHVNGPTNSGAESRVRIVNDANDTSAGARLLVECGGSSASGDALLSALEAGSHQITIGIDTSANTGVIAMNAALGSSDGDAVRITDATPPVATYNATHPTGTFDYVCEGCGKHGSDTFNCCGLVAWHDDVQAMASVLAVVDGQRLTGNEPAIQHLAKLGVMEVTPPDWEDETENWIGLAPVAAQWFTWSGMQQMANRIRDLESRLETVGV